MKPFFKFLCLCLTFLLPFATAQAKLTGEVIFRPPINAFNELWITNVEKARDDHPLFTLGYSPEGLAVQTNGNLVVTMALHNQLMFGNDIYVFDKEADFPKVRDLTRQQFSLIWGLDISQNGDIVFTHERTGPAPATGIYLIPKHELKKLRPKVYLLKEGEAYTVEWSSSGKHIVYSTSDGVCILNILTQEVLQISRDGGYPAFSPDGRYLAFANRAFAHGRWATTYTISIVSLTGRPNLKAIETQEAQGGYFNLKWSPDGQYVVYTIRWNGTYRNFAAPINGGPHEEFLDEYEEGVWLFDWTQTDVAYAVEPTNRLTTLWGKLKQQDLK
ncbi:MAG: hypothetical protein OXH39_11060 [Candidatus Poribacteria bacterium]|nr:hypothetical protein [Candidatus Poribacteria bacterium]